MWIVPEKGSEMNHAVAARVAAAVSGSRFRCALDADVRINKSRRYGVQVYNVRLLRAKSYCGQHPGPCQANPFFERKHPVGTWLEGLDWVSWNWLLNTVLDRMELDADVFSYNRESRESRYYARRGRRRRVHYQYDYVSIGYGRFANAWVNGPDWSFEDHCGKPPPPLDLADLAEIDGTPGILAVTPAGEQAWRDEYPEEFPRKRRRGKVARTAPREVSA